MKKRNVLNSTEIRPDAKPCFTDNVDEEKAKNINYTSKKAMDSAFKNLLDTGLLPDLKQKD